MVTDHPVGRELDALVADQVMGWTKVHDDVPVQSEVSYAGGVRSVAFGTRPLGWIGIRQGEDFFREIADYSADIRDAWDVVEHLPMAIIPFDGGGWYACVGEHIEEGGIWFDRQHSEFDGNCVVRVGGWVHADTAPLAICRAALKSVK